MPVYEYIAYDDAGRTRKGIVNADSPRLARQKLRSGGLFATSLAEARAESARTKGNGGGRGLLRLELTSRKVRRSELTNATRTLATLLGAGLPLVSALSGVLEQAGPATGMNRILTQVRERVNEGKSLAAAMAEHPDAFPTAYVAMVGAGEASGTLETVMQQLADFNEQQMALRRKVQSTLAYPILMLVVGVGVVFFLMTYVIPRMTEIFADMGQALPAPTVMLMSISSVFRDFWHLIILSGLGVWLVLRGYSRSRAGKPRIDSLKLRLPLFGTLIQRMVVARFSRTLGTLLKNGVPLLSSLDIVRNVVDNAVYEAAVDEMRQDIAEGASITAPLARRQLFPPTALQMIGAGEKSGKLEEMLLKVAEIYESEVESRLTILTSLLEPIMILSLGMVVGFVVLAVLLPMFEMSNLVQ